MNGVAMVLDPRTSILIVGILSVFISFFTLMLWRSYRGAFPDTWFLFLGTLAIGISDFLFGLRGLIPLVLSMTLANALMIGGLELCVQAYRRLNRLSVQLLWIAAAFAVPSVFYAAALSGVFSLAFRIGVHVIFVSVPVLRLFFLSGRIDSIPRWTGRFIRWFPVWLMVSLFLRFITVILQHPGSVFLLMPGIHHMHIIPYLFMSPGIIIGYYLILVARLFRQKDALIEEKENLLHEIHHRTRNHLAVTKALLNLEGLSSSDPRVKEILQSSGSRVVSIGHLHDMLHYTDSNRRIRLNSYLRDVADTVWQIFGMEDGYSLRINAAAITVDPKTASVCGLLVNELLNNSCKHSLRDRPGSCLQLDLFSEREGVCSIAVTDNGAGYQLEQLEGVETRLINGWVGQLDGELEPVAGVYSGFRFNFSLPDRAGVN